VTINDVFQKSHDFFRLESDIFDFFAIENGHSSQFITQPRVTRDSHQSRPNLIMAESLAQQGLQENSPYHWRSRHEV
jgi:hypothetical protein